MLHLRAHTIRKAIFLTLCCTAAGGLLASFSRPLESLEVWQQKSPRLRGMSREEIFILTESEMQYPERLNRSRATQIMHIRHHFRLEKLSALFASLLASSAAIVLANALPESDAGSNEESRPNSNPPGSGSSQEKSEVLLSKMRGRWQQMSEQQKALFREQIRTLAKLVEDAPASPVSEQVSQKRMQLSDRLHEENTAGVGAMLCEEESHETPEPARFQAKREKCVAK